MWIWWAGGQGLTVLIIVGYMFGLRRQAERGKGYRPVSVAGEGGRGGYDDEERGLLRQSVSEAGGSLALARGRAVGGGVA
jgi:hypothetical protein